MPRAARNLGYAEIATRTTNTAPNASSSWLPHDSTPIREKAPSHLDRTRTTNTRFLGKQIRATYAPARRNAPQVQKCATRTLPDASSPNAETPLPTTACIAPLTAVLKLNATASSTAAGGARITRRARLRVVRVGSLRSWCRRVRVRRTCAPSVS